MRGEPAPSSNQHHYPLIRKPFSFFPPCTTITFTANICWYSMAECMSLSMCFWVHRTALSLQTGADIHLTDIRGDSSTVAYGNRLLTAKTWHQRKQVSQAWHSVLLRGLRDRLSAYSGIITPIRSTLIPDKGERSKQTERCSRRWKWLRVWQKQWRISDNKSKQNIWKKLTLWPWDFYRDEGAETALQE